MTLPVASPATPIDSTESTRFCSTCGYDLRALTLNRCPECGNPFDPTARPAPLPWIIRAHLGTWTAFWETVLLVVLHPRQLADHVRRDIDIDPDAANHFRILCARIFTGTLAISPTLLLMPSANVIVSVLVGLATIPGTRLFCWFAATPIDTNGLPTDLHERRFCRLHPFMSAPLALAPMLILPATLAGMIFQSRGNEAPYAIFATLGLLLIWFVYLFAFQAIAARRSLEWMTFHVIIALLLWVTIGVFCLMLACGSATIALVLCFIMWPGSVRF